MQGIMEIIKADERGYADHGWLKARHTFSFADYYDPQRVNFGLLRVLNDDIVAPHRGFSTHPHNNMEIITIPLKGELEHQDSTGVHGIIKPGEVQVMSAGSGVYHSEKNPGDEYLNLFQIWIYTNKRNADPRYDQKSFDPKQSIDRTQILVSPDGREDSLMIYQNAFISWRKCNNENMFTYDRFVSSNGLLFMIIEGTATVGGEKLKTRDTLLLENNDRLEILPEKNSFYLFIEVPMSVAD